MAAVLAEAHSRQSMSNDASHRAQAASDAANEERMGQERLQSTYSLLVHYV